MSSLDCGNFEASILVDGVLRSRFNSVNELIDSSDSALKSFWRWFGNSQAVDPAGRPTLVYHGTRRQFDEFKAFAPSGAAGNPAGVYFAPDRRVAEEYSQDCDGAVDERSRIISAYLRIESGDEGLVRNHSYSGREYVVFDMSSIMTVGQLSIDNVHALACAEVSRRFDIPSRSVHEIATIPPEVLVARMSDKYSARTAQVDYPHTSKRFELGAVRMNEFGGDHENRYVDYVQCFKSTELINAEEEQGIKKTSVYATYLNWAKAGHSPPYISVFETDKGHLQSTNRRRTLVAQELDLPIYGWLSRINPETGDGLKYGEVMSAYQEASLELQSGVQNKAVPQKRPRP